jgi:hypothetical protein
MMPPGDTEPCATARSLARTSFANEHLAGDAPPGSTGRGYVLLPSRRRSGRLRVSAD